MNKGVLKVTACCLAAGMTISGMSSVAFAVGDQTLAGFGSYMPAETEAGSEAEQTAELPAGTEDISGEADAQTDAAPETQSYEAPDAGAQESQEAQEHDYVAPDAGLQEGYIPAAYVQTEAQDTASEETGDEVQDSAPEANEDVTQDAAPEAGDEVQDSAPEANEDVTQDAVSEEAWDEVQDSAPEAAWDAAQETEPVLDTSMSGEMAFAQCDEYINIRSGASADSDVVGKVYNNNSVTILGQVGDWYEVQSGNATGYVKADYFATGQAAEEIAEEVAYNVATVYAEALTVRSEPSEDAEQIGMAYSTDELEVVDYDGDWMKVALGGDAYGYVNAYYVGYDTYYATGETLEEEQERLDQEWLDYLAEQEAQQAAAEQAYLDAVAAEEAAAQQAAWDAQYQAQQATWDAQYQAQQAAADAEYQAQATLDAQAQADAQYQAYLNAQAEADAATQQADEQAVLDAAAQAEAAYQEYLNAQAAADAQAQAEADAQAQAQAAQDAAAQAEADAQAAADAAAQAAAAQAAADAAAQAAADDSYTDSTYTESSSSSSLGQQVVDYATQFVGNPYVWGGSSLTNGADCSGFTMSVYANFGVSLPHNAAAQSGCGTPVDLSEIQAGDLLFYEGSGGIGHVTIYMGNGQVVHASSSTTGIIISDYNYRTPVCARRFL